MGAAGVEVEQPTSPLAQLLLVPAALIEFGACGGAAQIALCRCIRLP